MNNPVEVDSPNPEKSWENRWSSTMMNNYGEPPLQLISGRGARVRDSQGKEYVDFLAGIAVNSLGYGNEKVAKAVATQASSLTHTSNLFSNKPSLLLAEKLKERLWEGRRDEKDHDADSDRTMSTTRVAFCNSGTEANEMAFKLARLTGKRRILAALNGFHGRTMGALAMTGQPAKRDIFGPLPGGVEFFHYNDTSYLEKFVEIQPDEVAAIIVEPIQGETGVIPASRDFFRDIRRIADRVGALMICDEVQTGNGRTGDYFAFQDAGIIPDVVTTAKGLSAGLPIGACVATGRASSFFTPGAHGSTFAGNPVAASAGLVVQQYCDDGLVDHVKSIGSRLRTALSSLPHVVQVRGRGLMLGVVLDSPIAKEVVSDARDRGVILNAPAESVLRVTPPLVLTDEECDEGVSRLKESLESVVRDQ